MESLFENIGKKLKNLAAWSFFIETFGAVICGIVLMENNTGFAGFITMIVGTLIAWASSCFLYAIGELVDKTCQNERNTAQMLQILKARQEVEREKPISTITSATATKVEKQKIQEKPMETTVQHRGSTTFTVKGASTIVCDRCKQEQPENRRVCWNCGARFQWEVITEPEKQWRCAKCGNMVNKTPCPHCGEED